MFSITPKITREFTINKSVSEVQSALDKIANNVYQSKLDIERQQKLFSQRDLYVRHKGMALLTTNFAGGVVLSVDLAEVDGGTKVQISGSTTYGAINSEVEYSYVDTDMTLLMQCLQLILFPEEAKANGISSEGVDTTWIWILGGIFVVLFAVLAAL